MIRAIELARRCASERGRVAPLVGAVVARDGEILGEAFRGELAPGDHAEFTALEKKLKDSLVAGATLFTTLEPCTSRTPPKVACADRVVERRIARVVIGMLDPNDAITGLGELRLREAQVAISRFDPDLMATIEELNREFIRLHSTGSKRRRPYGDMSDPVEPGQVGPNGYRVGYTPEGDKVEWVPSDDGDDEWPLLLRRNDSAILAAYNEFWDKVWWNRHQNWIIRIETGQETLTDEQAAVLARAKEAAQRIEDKYGAENLGWDEFEWGLLSGRMSALSWVLGAEWDESLDT